MATKKSTTSTAPTNAAAQSETAVVHSEQAGADTLLPVDAGSVSANTPESVSTGGAGNAASPTGLADAVILALVDEAGCADAQHMVAMAKLGLSVFEYLDDASHRDGPLKGFPLHEDPAQMVPYLFEMVVALENKLAFREAPAEAEGKRGFILLKAVRIDNHLTEMHKPVWLTKEQHAELAAVDACDDDWDNGVRG